MRRCWLWIWGVLSVLACAWAQEPLIHVEVVDESGKPVPNASVSVYALMPDGQRGSDVAEPRWVTTNAQGRATFNALRIPFSDEPDWMFKQYPRWELRASAPGFLPLKQVIEKPQRGATVRATFRRGGRAFTLTLRNETGKPIPEPLALGVCAPIEELTFTEFDTTRTNAWAVPQKVYSQFGIEPQGEGRYKITLPEDYAAPLTVMVHHEGFLRCFNTTVDAETVRRGAASVTLPPAHTLTLRYDVSQVDAKKFKEVQVSLTGIQLDSFQYEGIPLAVTVYAQNVSGQGEARFEDLPPGEYVAEILGFPVGEGGNLLSLRQRFRLRDGKAHAVELAYAPPDAARYRGEKEHTVRLLGVDGKPAARQPFQLVTFTEAGESVVVLQGETDSEGRAHLKQLKEGVFYRLEAGKRPTSVAFVLGEEEFTPPAEGYIAPAENDPAPDVELRPAAGGKLLRLSELRGKWVYLDFWATWCGPCRKPLQQLAAELPGLKETYKDRAVALTVSIDDSPEPIQPYLSELGLWAHGGHYWAGEGGWRSPVAQRFVVLSIPQAMLIDPNGVIRWRGYPMDTATALLQKYMAQGQ
ncbi:MAG: redoxin domain-containing protein [Fimbriimonadales bacterium]|nr:redoxin domain-containing protein [Fimbriimonadales bacterium]